MPYEDFLECKAMEVIEPSGEAQADARCALLCTVIANHSPGRKTPATMEEYLKILRGHAVEMEKGPAFEGDGREADRRNAELIEAQMMRINSNNAEIPAGMRKMND